jgi:hypothetical protein
MARDERKLQAATGIAVIAGMGVAFLLLVMATGLPGVAGEFFVRIAGIVTTPFLMEATLAVSGLLLVILINQWRQHREGDEFVYLEEVKDAPEGLPEQARWAAYRDQPLDSGGPATTDLLEGAIAIGDHASATELLESMTDEERHRPEVMRQRVALAKATGKEELARRLESELDQ